MSALHWRFSPGGSSGFTVMTFGNGGGPAWLAGSAANESVGLAGVCVSRYTRLNGGLLVRKVKVFIWFGL
jgi:hypothetical protein